MIRVYCLEVFTVSPKGYVIFIPNIIFSMFIFGAVWIKNVEDSKSRLKKECKENKIYQFEIIKVEIC